MLCLAIGTAAVKHGAHVGKRERYPAWCRSDANQNDPPSAFVVVAVGGSFLSRENDLSQFPKNELKMVHDSYEMYQYKGYGCLGDGRTHWYALVATCWRPSPATREVMPTLTTPHRAGGRRWALCSPVQSLT